MEWIKQEISQAHELDQNVILLLSFSWKSEREFNNETIHEKEELAEHIMRLKFNTVGKPWLVMISGDSHMLSYDNGSTNIFGGFPIF
jgi:hypothetical protein